MRRPPTKQFRDIPIASFAEWDRVGQIHAILRELEYGIFHQASMLADAMLRDDRINGVLSTRVGGLTSAPLEFYAAKERRKAQKIAELLGGDDQNPGLWDLMFPPSVVGEFVKWGKLIGIAVGELVWTTTARAWTPRVKIWHPQFLHWDWTESRYHLMTQDGIVKLPKIDEQPRSDGKWFVWCPHGYQYGWMQGLLRSLAMLYLGRQWTYRDALRYSEVHGQPVTKAFVPEGADAETKESFFNDVANRGSDTTVMVPVGEGGRDKGYDVQLTEAMSKTHEVFFGLLDKLEVSIAVNVLGQNLTTEVQEGSRAAAEVQNQIRLDKRREDALIAGALRSQVLTWWAEYNFGDPELAPRPEYQVDPPEDEAAESNALKALGDALISLQTAGAPVDVRAILDHAGVPMLSEEEVADAEAEAAEQAEAKPPADAEKEESANPETPNEEPGAAKAGEGADEGALVSLADVAHIRLTPDARRALGVLAKTLTQDGIQRMAVAMLKDRKAQALKRYEFQGLPIAVETPAGELRRWKDADGTEGQTRMLYDYGYIEGHLSGDGEELDVYVGPDSTAPEVHVVHQLLAPEYKRHDEDKVMLGFMNAAAAKASYLAHRSDGDRAFGGMSSIPLARFKAKLKRRAPETIGKIRASASDLDRTVGSIMALVQRTPSAVLRRGPAKGRAKVYADLVAERGQSMAARALAVDLVAVKQEIDAAESFDDLRQRLVARFKEMEPAKLARIVEKVNLMAHLGGRLSAVKDL